MTSNGVMQHIAARTAPITPVVMRVWSRMAGELLARVDRYGGIMHPVATTGSRTFLCVMNSRRFIALTVNPRIMGIIAGSACASQQKRPAQSRLVEDYKPNC